VNLEDIRNGLQATLADLPDVRVEAFLPDNPESLLGANPLIVIQPDEPYVTYTEGSGRVNQNEIRFRLLCLPSPQMGAVRVQKVLDELLSCGTSEARSLRTKLGSDISANGTACAVSVLQASIRRFPIGPLEITGAEVQIMVKARC